MNNEYKSIRIGKDNGLQVTLSDFGARITSIQVPTPHEPIEVHEYYEDLSKYSTESVYSGATIGPYANRIAHAKFTIDNTEYSFEPNWRNHLLHSGELGWHSRKWQIIEKESDMVTFQLENSDGDPIEFKALVTYMVTMDQGLMIQYEVEVDRPFPINMTNHGNFNLSQRRDLSSHQFEIFGRQITEVNEDHIPTGQKLDVQDSPFDLRQMRGIADDSFDHNYVLDKEIGTMSLAARALASDTSITMECYTTQPGLHFYNGYPGFFCFESQHFPDSPNQPSFPSTIVTPSKGYKEQCLYKFYWEKSDNLTPL